MKHQCSWTASDLILLSWQTVPKELCWPEFKLLYFQSKTRLNYCKAHVIMQKSQFILQHVSICFENIHGLVYMYLYVLKMWGFFFLYCVWINGFYSLLDSRFAYTSANVVHILLPQHLLYAYCHTNVNVKNVSHDSCTEVLCEWAGICFSYDYGLVLCSSFLLTSLHPDIPKIRKQTPLCLGMQSWMLEVCSVLQCCKKAQFHFLWHCITTEGKVCFYWAFRFRWSQAWNLYGLANLQSSCLWIAIWVWHTCTT